MGKRIFQFFRIWGNLVIALITIYSFAVTYFVSSPTQQRELASLFGWSWQTWLIILLVSIILTYLIQDLFEKYEKKESEKFKGEHSTIHSSAEDGSNAFSIGNLHAERVSITQGSNPKIIEDDNLQIRIKIHSDTSSPYGRILYLTVYNESQGDIEDYEVKLKDAQKENSSRWKLHGAGSLFNGLDKHLLIKAGGYVDVAMIKTNRYSPGIIFLIPYEGLESEGGKGHYYIDVMIFGIYNRKPFEIPINYEFNHDKQHQYSDLRFVKPDNFSLQITSASIEYSNEVIYEFKR